MPGKRCRSYPGTSAFWGCIRPEQGYDGNLDFQSAAGPRGVATTKTGSKSVAEGGLVSCVGKATQAEPLLLVPDDLRHKHPSLLAYAQSHELADTELVVSSDRKHFVTRIDANTIRCRAVAPVNADRQPERDPWQPSLIMRGHRFGTPIARIRPRPTSPLQAGLRH